MTVPIWIPREKWGARPARKAANRRSTKGLVIHYTTGEELAADRAETLRWVRSIQTYHQKTRGWNDIGYNVLVDRFGRVIEGRGWDVVGAHAPGANATHVGCAYLGDDDPGQDVTAEAREALVWVRDQVAGRYDIRPVVEPHSKYRSTSCPGDELRGWIAAGMPLDGRPAAAPRRIPLLFSPLKTGVVGADVALVQAGLIMLGYDAGVVDGDFGPNTAAALKSFETDHHLRADGIMGGATWPVFLRALVDAEGS